jgi:hypothetical protein
MIWSGSPTARSGAVVFLAVFLAACDASPTAPPALRTPPSAMLQDGGAARPWTMDDEYARIAREEVPGFAGYYLDGSGEAVIQLVDESRVSSARAALARAGTRGSDFTQSRSRRAAYDFNQLKQWMDALVPALPRGQPHMWDVDEVRNRVVIGVAEQRQVAAVRESARAVGVPAGALDVEVTQFPQPRTTLLDYQRPVVGGIRVHVGPDSDACTLGVSVRVDYTKYLLTASHCDYVNWGTVSGVQMAQGGGVIGHEVYDAPWKKFLNCPAPSTIYKCRQRWSDAAFYQPSADNEPGLIARTVGGPVTGMDGTLTIDAMNPTLRVMSGLGDGALAPQTVLHKMGSTSGWTQGQVLVACVSWSTGGLAAIGDTLRCMMKTNIWSKPGDSGAPIFRMGPSDAGGVALAGILFGGPYGSWDTTWFSSLDGITRDYGFGLTVHYIPPPLMEYLNVTGYSSIQPNASCLYVVGPIGDGVYEWSIDGAYYDSGYEVRVSRTSDFHLSVVHRVNGQIIGAGGMAVTVSSEGQTCIDM